MKSNNKYCIRDNKITISKTTYEESLGVVIIFFFSYITVLFFQVFFLLFSIIFIYCQMNQETYSKKLDNTQITNIISTLLSNHKRNNNTFALSEQTVASLCYSSKSIFLGQPMLLELNPPICICGDIHGQFDDLKEIFKSIGTPTQGKSFLFLGDYVDRGKQSLQCICLLFAYKIQFPQKIFLLRGNHECSDLNKIYGFYDECKRRLSLKAWNYICDVFRYLPVAAVVGDRIFCVHGGLSPCLNRLQAINQILRPVDPKNQSIVNDLLWSDPTKSKGWTENLQRGISYCFGEDIIQKFLQKNDFDLICRSHQVAQEGYQFFADRRLITIFSCPNYCGLYDNFGAIIIVNKDLTCEIKQFQKQCLIKMKLKRQKTPDISDIKLSEQFLSKIKQRSSIQKRSQPAFLSNFFTSKSKQF